METEIAVAGTPSFAVAVAVVVAAVAEAPEHPEIGHRAVRLRTAKSHLRSWRVGQFALHTLALASRTAEKEKEKIIAIGICSPLG